MHNNPLVTVICLCYNHAEFVVEALESVINQSHSKVELIIADDFSTDNSVEVIQKWLVQHPEIPFIANTQKIVPDKNSKNNIDLSEISWTSSDELMTETLAKVFVKQQKYTKALQAYQILGLKYPEKNSFFADQIKEIKRLQKLKD